MTKKIITTYTEYDEDGKIKSQSVTETPYPDDDCDLDCECCDCVEPDEDDDDAVYQLTPKGIACLALLRTGLIDSVEDPPNRWILGAVSGRHGRTRLHTGG